MIEVQLRDIVGGIDILNEITKKSLKARPAFVLARILRELEKEIELFQKNRENLINKYCERDSDNNLKVDEKGNYTIPTDKVEIFNSELNELLDTVLQLNIDYINLKDIEDIDFTVQQMNVMCMFIKE